VTDWGRAEWQYKANKVAVRLLCILILLQAPEIYEAFKYHFPWWDDAMEALTTPLTAACWFVKKHTDMYRWDI
jgi:hypothetical protein